MIRKDYIEKQIDETGKFLQKLLEKLLGLKEKDIKSAEAASQALKSELNLDLDKLKGIPEPEFIRFLIEEKRLSITNVDLLAEIMFQLYRNTNDTDVGRKTLILYNYLKDREKTFSFERYYRMEDLKKKTE